MDLAHLTALIQDLQVRVTHARSRELLRKLTLDPTKDYEPTGAQNGKSSET